jgi:anti-sigma B factor antagonist
MNFYITESIPKENTTVLAIEGRLNAVTVAQLKTRMKELVGSDTLHIILDLAGMTFIDSSGLSAIVSGLKTTGEKGGSLKLVGLSDNTMSIFELTRLARVFDFYANVDEALATII